MHAAVFIRAEGEKGWRESSILIVVHGCALADNLVPVAQNLAKLCRSDGIVVAACRERK
jgi:hypothetical protein